MPRAITSPTRPSTSAARRQREPLPNHTKNSPAKLRALARHAPAPLRAEGGLAHEHAKTGHILDIASRRAAATTSPAHTIPPEKLTHSRNSVAVSLLCTEPDSVCPLFLAELKRALSRDQVHVILSRPKSDMGIVQVDAIRTLAEGDPARKRLRYIARLYDKEFHVLASREIIDLRQLQGRKVNIDKPGTGTHLMARHIFEKLGVAAEFVTDDQARSYEKLRSGDIAAAVYVAPRPASTVAEFQADGRFHLVPIPYGNELTDYLPAQLHVKDYPKLIPGDRPVETVAVGTVLAVWNGGSERSERYKRLARFVDIYFSRYHELRKALGHAEWDEANALATAPGWERGAVC